MLHSVPMKMLTMLTAVHLLLLVHHLGCTAFRYDGYSAINVVPQSEDDVDLVRRFAKRFVNDETSQLQFVRPPYRPDFNISVIAAPESALQLVRLLEQARVPYEIIISDYQMLIDREFAENRQALFQTFFRSGGRVDHSVYLRYKQIDDWLAEKVSGVEHASMTKFGHTFENRQLFLMKISKNESLPIVWLDGGIHAREWIATSSVLYVIDMLLQNSSEAANILSKFQFMVLPLVNPDGYEYSHETHRLWRKNRSRHHRSNCVGVDMNRNFPYEWGGESSSPDPCNDQYHGVRAGSEPEIQAVMGKMRQLQSRIQLVVSVHAFGQYILQPFSFSHSHYPSNYLDMTSVAIRTAFDLQNKHGVYYQVGRPPDILYPASGSSDDFAVGTLKIPFSYTVELPDQGLYGFTLPPRFIRSVGNQLWDIVLGFANQVHKSVS